MQKTIDNILKKGLDCKYIIDIIIFIVPDELKEKMKMGELGKQFNIEQKMSLREKQKAKKLFEEE